MVDEAPAKGVCAVARIPKATLRRWRLIHALAFERACQMAAEIDADFDRLEAKQAEVGGQLEELNEEVASLLQLG